MLQIRKAVPDDALGISIVNVYTWKTTYSGLMPEAVIDKRIEQLVEKARICRSDIEQNDKYIVAEADEAIVGFCIFEKSRNEMFRAAGEITALYVLKGFQKLGIGKALFLAGVNELRKKEHSSMIINCLKGNPTINFYTHMGGRIAAQRQDEIAGESMVEDIVYFDLNAVS